MLFPLRLHKVQLQDALVSLFVPDRDAVKEAYEKGLVASPYWSQVWPAAKALSQFIINHPGCTKTKTVVELGAGLGLPSLVAAGNATSVLCTDCIPEAVEIAKQSAAHLKLKNFTAEAMDWQNLPEDLEADVLLLSDVNYEPAVFVPLMKTIISFLQRGSTVILSTPQRLMAKEFVSALLVYCIQQEEIPVEHEGNRVPITVLVLQMQ
jgi:predicted nicotinamide N-methyase